MTPHILPVDKKIAHGRSRYSENEKVNNVDNLDGTPIFAYMRKSTNKKEQEESLVQQEEGITSIAKKMGLNEEGVRYFIETRSGFENKRRKEWEKMLVEIDTLKTPCILLCRDISRLSRNPTDSMKIMDRVYGDNSFKKKAKISKIYSLEYGRLKEWSKKTDKEEMHKALSTAYYDSLETRKNSIGGILLKLENGEFPYHAPQGLKHTSLKGKKVLKQNEKIVFIRRAFEMKVERRGHKEIAKYLRRYGEIKIGEKELTERYFTNTVYIGKYTEKTTGQEFTRLDFAEGKPPIALSLWDKVQKCLSKRGRIYRDDSQKDIFEERGLIEGGGLLARDIKKKPTKKGESTYIYYKNTKANINIVQHKILVAFLEAIERVIFVWSVPYVLKTLEGYASGKGISKEHSDLIKKEIELIGKGPEKYFEGKRLGDMNNYSAGIVGYFLYKISQTPEKRQEESKTIYQRIMGGAKSSLYEKHPELKDDDKFNSGLESLEHLFLEDSHKRAEDEILKNENTIRDIFTGLPFFEESKNLQKVCEQQKSQLEQEKGKLEEEKKNYRRKAVNLGFSATEIEETSKDIEKSIDAIEGQINELSIGTEMEDLLKRLPQILSEIVELSHKALAEEEIEKKKEDIIKLFEMTVSNFSVGNKKELKIKLFEVLDVLVNGGKFSLEVWTPANMRTFIENYDKIKERDRTKIIEQYAYG